MKKLGSLSASQIVSLFRHDWALLQSGIKWPEDGSASRLELPIKRLAALIQVRHVFASFPILECDWTFYWCLEYRGGKRNLYSIYFKQLGAKYILSLLSQSDFSF